MAALSNDKPLVTLIDASHFIFRAYHAVPHLSTSKGVPTNAVYGFTRMMLKTLKDFEPAYVALAFDKESRSERLKIDPQYKANREAAPPDLVPQFELIRQVVQVLQLPILEAMGWEADDVIGTLARKAKAEGFQVRVITGDKDFVQIVDEDVRLFDPMTERHTGPEEVKTRLGIEPHQMRDYLALIGDAIDNVAKVPGVGPKTAAELLREFHDVETLLSRLAEVKKPKIREALESHRESLLRAKELVSFKMDLPLDIEMAQLARKPVDDAAARTLFSELEFFKLLQEMPAVPPTPLATLTEVVKDEASLQAFVARAQGSAGLSLVPAFEGPPATSRMVGLGVSLEDGSTFYVPLRHRTLDAGSVSPELFGRLVGPLLADSAVTKSGHDLKSLTLLLGAEGLSFKGVSGDAELLSYLLNPSRREHALVDLARERLLAELPPLPPSVEGKKGRALADHAPDEVANLYGTRADAARRLVPGLWTELERLGLAQLARGLELPVLPVLARMERRGVKVDLEVFARLSTQVDAECQSKLQSIHALVGHDFNVGSNLQLAQVLYTELNLPVLKRGKTGPSTDQEVLEKLAQQHPLPRAIIEYRGLSKLKSTYLDTLPSLVAADGRIHTTYHQAATATGRISSTDPNLQNIPIRTELGREIRRAFVAEPGHRLISADYSQVELRLLAHIAEDPVLLDAFAQDEDIHSRTAAEIFGVKPAEVNRDQRRVAKTVNFGIAYGLSPHGLSTRLDISVEEARDIIERYFNRYAGIRRYLDETVERARKVGYVETLFGRRRLMGDLLSKNRNVAQAAERAAINMPIQGTAADLMKMAMLAVDKALAEEGLEAAVLLQVHDELLFEAPEGEVERVQQLAQRCMQSVATLKVPLKVDVGAGLNWADAH